MIIKFQNQFGTGKQQNQKQGFSNRSFQFLPYIDEILYQFF